MIQIDGTRRRVYKIPRTAEDAGNADSDTGAGGIPARNGEFSKVRIEAVGLGMTRVKVANLPPEVADGTLKMALGTYGDVREIQAETWSNAYRYPVPNCIRVVI
jgi:hypothetical protein